MVPVHVEVEEIHTREIVEVPIERIVEVPVRKTWQHSGSEIAGQLHRQSSAAFSQPTPQRHPTDHPSRQFLSSPLATPGPPDSVTRRVDFTHQAPPHPSVDVRHTFDTSLDYSIDHSYQARHTPSRPLGQDSRTPERSFDSFPSGTPPTPGLHQPWTPITPAASAEQSFPDRPPAKVLPVHRVEAGSVHRLSELRSTHRTPTPSDHADQPTPPPPGTPPPTFPVGSLRGGPPSDSEGSPGSIRSERIIEKVVIVQKIAQGGTEPLEPRAAYPVVSDRRRPAGRGGVAPTQEGPAELRAASPVVDDLPGRPGGGSPELVAMAPALGSGVAGGQGEVVDLMQIGSEQEIVGALEVESFDSRGVHQVALLEEDSPL
eukprot:EG_transcript_16688